MTTDALARQKASLPAKPLDSIAQLSTVWAEMKNAANLVTPLARVDSIMAMHGVSMRWVMIDPEADCYEDKRFCKNGDLAPGKLMLTKLMNAAGVEIVATNRLDDRANPFYCHMEVTLSLRDFDGTVRMMKANKECDFRDGAPETLQPEWIDRKKTGKMVRLAEGALSDKRRHIAALCETKAMERCLRILLNVKQKYTREELARPFVVPKLVPLLDASDPETKAAILAHTLGGESALTGGHVSRETLLPAATVTSPEDTPTAGQLRGAPFGEGPDETPAPVAQPEPPATTSPSDDPWAVGFGEVATGAPVACLPVDEKTMARLELANGPGGGQEAAKRLAFIRRINSIAEELRAVDPDVAPGIFKAAFGELDPEESALEDIAEAGKNLRVALASMK